MDPRYLISNGVTQYYSNHTRAIINIIYYINVHCIFMSETNIICAYLVCTYSTLHNIHVHMRLCGFDASATQFNYLLYANCILAYKWNETYI